MLKVILGSFGAFPIFDNFVHVSRKRHVLEQNVHLNLYVIQFNVVIVGHPVKQIIKAPGLLTNYKDNPACLFPNSWFPTNG